MVALRAAAELAAQESAREGAVDQQSEPLVAHGGKDLALAAIYVEQLRYYRARGPLLAAIAEVAAYDTEMREAGVREIDRFTRHITMLLEGEQKAGRLGQEVDAATAAQVLAWGG
ncbi:hypothetical protein PV703_29400 [Streptomyces sp. ME01-24h]|nr:hypothetical protein [Streptomyces sp. ME01-24h]